MDIELIYNRIDFLMRKYRGAFISEDEFSSMLDMGSKAVFNTMIEDAVKTGKVNAALNPFRKLFDYTAGNFTGEYLSLPSDYVYPTQLYIKGWDNKNGKPVEREIRIKKHDEWLSAINSQIVVPTINKPVVQEVGGGRMEFYPAQAYDGRLRYLRMPVVPKIVFDYSGATPVYVPGQSVQLEWNDTEVDMVIFKALSLIGINLNAQDLTAYAEGKLDKSLQTANKE